VEAYITKLLQTATAANLAYLLEYLTSCCKYEGYHTLLARALEHDRDHVHLLHPAADNSAGQQQDAAAAAAWADALLPPPPQQQQEQQQEQEQQQLAPAVLLMELLDTAVAMNSTEAVHLLCSAPAARDIGEHAMLPLASCISSKPYRTLKALSDTSYVVTFGQKSNLWVYVVYAWKFHATQWPRQTVVIQKKNRAWD
jgi:hypothetical protein